MPIDALFSSISVQNQVTPAGSIGYLGRRVRVAPEMAFDSVQALGDMRIGRPGSTEIMRLADVATITREEVEVPPQMIRHDGRPVFTVGVSVVPGRNVVEVGQAVDVRIAEMLRQLPLGVSIDTIYAQHAVVASRNPSRSSCGT